MLRVFGKQTDKIIDREKEKMLLRHLNAAGFGAEVTADASCPITLYLNSITSQLNSLTTPGSRFCCSSFGQYSKDLLDLHSTVIRHVLIGRYKTYFQVFLPRAGHASHYADYRPLSGLTIKIHSSIS